MIAALTPLRLITFHTDPATLVAQARGLFKEEALDVQITITPNSIDQMRGLSSGTWDVASTAFDNVLGWSGREGTEIIAGAQVADRIILPVMVRPEIKDWRDLQGKKLAVDAVDTAYALVLRRVLLAHDLDMDRGDYELVPVGATQHRLESMTKGYTYAGILNPPWDGKALSAGMVRFADHREVLPDYPGGVFAVTRSWIEGRRADLVKFLKIWLTALCWANDKANRNEAVRLIASAQGINEDIAAKQMERLPSSGDLNIQGLESVLDLRIRFGLIPPKGEKLSSYYDSELYREALKV